MAFLIPEVQHYFIRANKHFQFLLPGNGFISSYLSFHNDLHWCQGGLFCCLFVCFHFCFGICWTSWNYGWCFSSILKNSQPILLQIFILSYFLSSLSRFKLSVCWLSYYFLSVLTIYFVVFISVPLQAVFCTISFDIYPNLFILSSDVFKFPIKVLYPIL